MLVVAGCAGGAVCRADLVAQVAARLPGREAVLRLAAEAENRDFPSSLDLEAFGPKSSPDCSKIRAGGARGAGGVHGAGGAVGAGGEERRFHGCASGLAVSPAGS
ncbi:hypothetical protein GCM10020358_79270 [Amorphoplanes nipponensis]|uniref:Uncharacterized protein n=1 Tax=Actinoplanes nipponensis TaxID=135950 RepID=A0A919JLQ0_9ACTN|nr:hypothetical protein Ani05nite_64050 [Actinoplanes nipponensis]